jgi:hypothetical protein
LGKSIEVIGIDAFILIFNKHNRTHYKQYYDMNVNDETIFVLTRNLPSHSGDDINSIREKYLHDLKEMNNALYSKLFKMSSISCIEEYLMKDFIFDTAPIEFEIYMHIKKLETFLLEEKTSAQSRLSTLPIDIIKMINDRILS